MTYRVRVGPENSYVSLTVLVEARSKEKAEEEAVRQATALVRLASDKSLTALGVSRV